MTPPAPSVFENPNRRAKTAHPLWNTVEKGWPPWIPREEERYTSPHAIVVRERLNPPGFKPTVASPPPRATEALRGLAPTVFRNPHIPNLTGTAFEPTARELAARWETIPRPEDPQRPLNDPYDERTHLPEARACGTVAARALLLRAPGEVRRTLRPLARMRALAHAYGVNLLFDARLSLDPPTPPRQRHPALWGAAWRTAKGFRTIWCGRAQPPAQAARVCATLFAHLYLDRGYHAWLVWERFESPRASEITHCVAVAAGESPDAWLREYREGPARDERALGFADELLSHGR